MTPAEVAERIASVTGKRTSHTRPGQWEIHCPAHPDETASAGVGTGDDGRVLLNCRAGCSVEEICRCAGLDVADLFPTPRAEPERPPTVAALAAHKGIPADELVSVGVHDLTGGRGVGITYTNPDTGETFVKERTALSARSGSRWPAGVPIMAYGLERLGMASDLAEAVHVVEGESDCWALWNHHIEAVGLPGASADKTLTPEAVARFNRYPILRVVREERLGGRDRGGEAFPRSVAFRLRELGYPGRIEMIRCAGHKDPSDLHRLNPDGFMATWDSLCASAPVWADECDGFVPRRYLIAANELARPEPKDDNWPAPPAEEAFHGPAGVIARIIGDHSETDPVAILIQTLVSFGNAVGGTPGIMVERTRHACNEFAVIAGPTGMGRKGSSWDWVRNVMGTADPEWASSRLTRGLASGEGLIGMLADETKGRDKRVLNEETEFARLLVAGGREGSTISQTIRSAWDGTPLGSMKAAGRINIENHHVSIIGHITIEELARLTTGNDLANGFVNRFLWCCSRRTQLIPRNFWQGDELEFLKHDVADAVKMGRHHNSLDFDRASMQEWDHLYRSRLGLGSPGVIGQVTSRAAPHVMRLSMIYALLDQRPAIELPHLRAATALWDYCHRSAEYLFGNGVGDAAADTLLRELRDHGEEGMTKTEVYNFLNRNSEKADRALDCLKRLNLIRSEKVKGQAKKPVTKYFST